MSCDSVIRQLNAVYFQAISMAWEERDDTMLKKLGVNGDIAHRIATLSFSKIGFLSGFKCVLFNSAFDTSLLDKMIENAERQSKQNDAIDELILFGASGPLLHELTGMYREVFSERAQRLGRVLKTGRPPRLSTAQIEQVIVSVHKHAELGFSIELFRHIYHDTQLSLDRVWIEMVNEPEEILIASGVNHTPKEARDRARLKKETLEKTKTKVNSASQTLQKTK